MIFYFCTSGRTFSSLKAFVVQLLVNTVLAITLDPELMKTRAV